MAESQTEQILRLECDVRALKEELGLTKRPRLLIRILIWILDSAVKYWVVLAAVLIGFVSLYYGVPYFESIKNSSITRESSNYYLSIGDSMMEHAEFSAADEAYSNALQINPNNIKATRGLMRARVLRPALGEESYASVVVDAKLKFLNELFEDDYVLPYWEAIELRDRGDRDDLNSAKQLFEESVRRNPRFIGGKLELGYTYLMAGDEIDAAMQKFNEALSLDPNYALAHNSVGYCYLFKMVANRSDVQCQKEALNMALDHLKKSDQVSQQRVDTKLNLGDAYRFSGKNSYEAALATHLNALEIVEESEPEKGNGKPAKNLNAVQLTFPYLAHIGGGPDIRTYVQVSNRAQMKTFVLYAVSFDYALLNQRPLAATWFAKAHEADKRKEYSEYFANRIQSIVDILKPSGYTKRWFEIRRDHLLNEDINPDHPLKLR